jgi:hypothetical protein
MLAAVLFASGCGGAEGSSTGTTGAATVRHSTTSGRTQVLNLRPTTRQGSLKPGYRVSERVAQSEGECTGTAGVGGFRCETGHGLHPWCWPLGGASTAVAVVCLGMPWKHAVAELKLAERLTPSPNERGEHAALWAVKLTTGQHCQALRGAAEYLNGVPVRFSCGGAPLELELLGNPSIGSGYWQIREAYLHPGKNGSFPYRTVGPTGKIAVAWYPAAAGI